MPTSNWQNYIRGVIAADGKETHNTGKKGSEDPAGKRNLNEFNVMSTEWGISLSSTRIDEKSNEIPEMQKVMKHFDCRGCVVTADAQEILAKEGWLPVPIPEC